MIRGLAGLRAVLDRAATPQRILIAGWLLFVVYAYPGFMTYDSVDQLLQARNGPIADWHPPVMAYLWKLTDLVIAGPFPMLVIQSVMFLVGLERILRHAMRARAAAITAVVIFLFPPVLAPMAVIWKDSQMAAFLVAGIAALLSPRRRWQILGCALIFLATTERYNAAAATFPIIVGLFVWRDGLSKWKRYAIATGVWLAITASTFVVNGALVEKKLHPWHSSLALHDIAGMLRYAQPIADDELQGDYDVLWTHRDHIQARVRSAYDPVDWHSLVTSEYAMFVQPTTDLECAAVAHAWLHLVTTHPRAYLKHRFRVFKTMLGLGNITGPHIWGEFLDADWEIEVLGHRATHSSVQHGWFAVIAQLDQTWVFYPWLYLILALAFLPFSRRDRLVFLLLASGLAYELAFFLVAPAVDYRYSHWMIVCTILAGVMIFTRRFAQGRHKRVMSS